MINGDGGGGFRDKNNSEIRDVEIDIKLLSDMGVRRSIMHIRSVYIRIFLIMSALKSF